MSRSSKCPAPIIVTLVRTRLVNAPAVSITQSRTRAFSLKQRSSSALMSVDLALLRTVATSAHRVLEIVSSVQYRPLRAHFASQIV